MVRWEGSRKVLANRCAWCGRWKTVTDWVRHLFGAETTHGCCEPCAKAMLEDYERKRGRAA